MRALFLIIMFFTAGEVLAVERETVANDLIDSYRTYTGLMAAVGHEVDQDALTTYLADEEKDHEELRKLLSGGAADGAGRREIADKAAGRMKAIEAALVREMVDVASWRDLDVEAASGEALLDRLRYEAEEKRKTIADAILLNGHRKLIRQRFVEADGLLEEALQEWPFGGRTDLSRLAQYLAGELARRGYRMSEADLLALLEQGGDSMVPQCLGYLIEQAEGRFRTGLIPLTELVGAADPDGWLEDVRRKLSFRSHSAMHKALSEATSLRYDCIHKALSGRRKAHRIQAEIKHCIDGWLRDLEAGREPRISDEYRGVAVGETQALLPELEQKYSTKEEIYRLIAQKAGIKTGSVRRYFQSNGQLKYAPLAVYRCACRLARGERDDEAQGPASYLADAQTRGAADELSRMTREALDRWHRGADDPELEVAYRELRRMLIATIKEQRHEVAVSV